MDDLFGWSNGSTDDSQLNISGFEWVRLFKYLRYKVQFFLMIFFYVLHSGLSRYRTVIQGKLATVLVNSNFDTPEDFLDSINNISFEIILVIIAEFVTMMISSICESFYLNNFEHDLKVELMENILNQDITYFDENETGVILSRVTEDVSNFWDSLTYTSMDFLYSIFDFLLGIVIILIESWQTLFITLLCLPIYGLSEFIGSKYINQLYLNYNDSKTKVNAKAKEILTSFRTVKPFDSELREYHSYRSRLFDVHHVLVKTSVVRAIQSAVESFANWGMASIAFYILGIQAVQKKIEPGTIVTIMSIIYDWIYSLTTIFATFNDFRKANISAAKIMEIIDRQPLIKNDEGNDPGHKIQGRIEFRNVSFKYPSREEYALKNLSFKVNKGETVALVGESGCGKSTTLQLLQRLYDTNEGQILIDDLAITDLKPYYLRSQISIVPQGPVIFSMSVKDNIRFGKPKSHREDVLKASMIANSHEFIVHLKEGYKTEINQNSLSGGQKQRICIARAVMMDSPIILFDEATAALDTESEKLVQESLTKLRNEKKSTSIVVAHRLATVRNASRILVMDKGKIVEEGTHDELIQRSGVYQHLVQHQLM